MGAWRPQVEDGKPLVLVVAFAFATPPQAWVNQVLRRKVFTLKQEFKERMFTYSQPDLAIGLKQVPQLRVIEEKEGQPSPTLRIVHEALAWAKEIDATEIRIVAAAPHVWRCKRDLKKVLKEKGAVLPVTVEHVPEVGWFGWFHHSSTQKRTRSAFAWYQRDILLWLMPWAIYKRVAG